MVEQCLNWTPARRDIFLKYILQSLTVGPDEENPTSLPLCHGISEFLLAFHARKATRHCASFFNSKPRNRKSS